VVTPNKKAQTCYKMLTEGNQIGHNLCNDPSREEWALDLKPGIKMILNRVRACGLDLYGSERSPLAGSCDQGYEPSGTIKCKEFLDHLTQ
jgi:hypothetical protein